MKIIKESTYIFTKYSVYSSGQSSMYTIITHNRFTTSTSYYGLSLYSSSLGGNIYLNLFISGAVEVPAYILSAVICRYWGYKNPLAASLTIAGLTLVANLFASGTHLVPSYIVAYFEIKFIHTKNCKIYDETVVSFEQSEDNLSSIFRGFISN